MIPHEPDIKVKQVTASLEVPQPPDPVAPAPLVFRHSMSQQAGMILFGLTLMSAAIGFLMAMVINQGGPWPFSPLSNLAGASLAVVVFIPLAIKTIRSNKTQARVEIIGSTIREFSEKGELYSEGSLREIESLVEKHAYRGPVRYYIFFKNGQVVSFNSEIDQEFRLRKVVCNWSGKKFEEVDMFAPNPTLDQIDSRYPSQIL